MICEDHLKMICKYYDIIYKDHGHKAIPFYEDNPKTITHE